MNYTEHYIKLLRIVNESSQPIRADNDYSNLDIRLFVELINVNYLMGTPSNPNIEKPTIMDMKPTVKGRIFQNDLEQKLYERTFKGKMLKHVPLYIAFALGLLTNIITFFLLRK